MLMNRKHFLVGYKVLFAALGLTAIVTEITVGLSRGVFVPANFFSFFTVEANIFAALVLLASAFATMRNKSIMGLALLRGAATLYMITTGVVFGVLLSGYDPSLLTLVPWDNTVLHYIIPVAVLVDWLIDVPPRRIVFKRSLIWLVFPILYLIYSLIRGDAVGWYPYPFLNPAEGGYGKVFIVAIGIALMASFVAFLLASSTNNSLTGKPRLRSKK